MKARLHPIEWIAAFAVALALLAATAFDLRFYVPNLGSTAFAVEHYIVPLAGALLLAHFSSWLRETGTKTGTWWRQARLVLAFGVVVYIHFNLKLWGLLITDARFDATFREWDEAIAPSWVSFASYRTISAGLGEIWPMAYHDVFVGMFLVSLGAHALIPGGRGRLGELATAIAAVLVIGGLSYAIAPAYGPFVFESGTNPAATAIQQQMLDFSTQFAASLGDVYSGHNFIMPLAAMPSLHVAHTLVLFWYAWRHVHWLSMAYLPAVAFIGLEAVAAGWHYAVDLVAGMVICLFCIACAVALHRSE